MERSPLPASPARAPLCPETCQAAPLGPAPNAEALSPLGLCSASHGLHCLLTCPLPPQLQMTLGDLMVPGLTTILLAYEHRQPALEQRFFNDCQVKLNLQCDRIKRRYLDRRDDAQHMSVYQMKGLGPGTASSLRPMSAMPILQQKSNRPGSSSYRRPFSAASSTDKPAMTRSSVSEVRQVDYSHLNVSRQLAMNSPGSQR